MGSVQTPLGFTEGKGQSESGLSSMCQVPCRELERGSRLETRQAAGCWLHEWPGEGDRCFGEGRAELGSDGQQELVRPQTRQPCGGLRPPGLGCCGCGRTGGKASERSCRGGSPRDSRRRSDPGECVLRTEAIQEERQKPAVF